MKTNPIKENTSNTTGSAAAVTTSSNPSTTTIGKEKPKPTVNVKRADLPNVIKNLKDTDTQVNVIDETQDATEAPKRLVYVSEVKDSVSGKISQPFTIGGKKYQMVRALSPDNEKVMGVYSFDDTDELGENLIYDVKDFENIAKKAVDEEEAQAKVIAEPAPEAKAEEPAETEEAESAEERMNPSFAGFKHFIVNKKTGKARKFKSIEELAKATMGEGEAYMGLKSFKKFVDEALFGAGKKASISEEDIATAGEDDIEMSVMAEKLMTQIKTKIPTSIIASIKTPVAQREVIAAFAKMIGVPRNGLSTLIAGLKDMSKTNVPVSESTGRKTIMTLKVKNLK